MLGFTQPCPQCSNVYDPLHDDHLLHPLHACHAPLLHVLLRVRVRCWSSGLQLMPTGSSSWYRLRLSVALSPFVPRCRESGDVHPALQLDAAYDPLHDDHVLHPLHACHEPLLHVLLRVRVRVCGCDLHAPPSGLASRYRVRVCDCLSPFVPPCDTDGLVQPCWHPA